MDKLQRLYAIVGKKYKEGVGEKRQLSCQELQMVRFV